MITQDFELFRDFILSKNPYFSTGYANAFRDIDLDAIYARPDGNLKAIFPDDRIGNYFYLRNDPEINLQPDRQKATSDCGVGRLGFNDVITCYLVAVVKDADEYELINNLRNTALMFSVMNIIPIQTMWQRENVINTEVSGLEEKEFNRFYERMKTETIVRLTLQINKDYLPNTCINNPCKTC